ncbi:MAG: aminopeptidase P family protein [Bacteroidales bacterium]|nr:aminopeptidase P family protein [Bacteroidales bacterium]
MIYADRIEELRAMMRSRGWDAVILTGSDPHGSEYPAERWKQVQWLTGFTGEAGDVVVTLDHAGLWTDTRYFIQAVQQLEGSGVELHKMRVPEQVPIPEWLAQHFEGEDEVLLAVDGLCVEYDFAAEIKSRQQEAGRACHMVSIPNLLDAIWEDRPQVPQTPVFRVDPGESCAERLGRLREWLREAGTDYVLLSALDEIAWVLNVRASDIEYNPLVISFLLVGRESADWFVLKEAVEDPETDGAFASLSDDGVTLRYYEEIEIALSDLDGSVAAGGLNYHLSSLLGSGRLRVSTSPVRGWKAVKNPCEIAGMRRSHFVDGMAMEMFLYWLEKSLEGDRAVSEWDAAVKLGQLRSEIPEYRGDSFETISAYGAGAALPHYITPHTGAPMLGARGLYLCDSGGQYWGDGSAGGRATGFGGTTDITRTVALGPCSRLEMEDYTLVLKGHIQLAMAVFPYGTPGCRIDALAREPLWKAGRSFGHGTGHGVGWFLGVHEGPQDVRQNLNPEGLVPGMIISDEPGIYREGMHGVRHENLLLCVDAGSNEFGRWCAFEPLTLCHFDTSALIPEMLTPEERDWLNSYNSIVYSSLAPELPRPVAEWLREKTKAI